MSLVLTIVNALRPSSSHLREVADFGTNPGGLRMLTYLPYDLPIKPALVVVLHGSAQSEKSHAAAASGRFELGGARAPTSGRC
jgi:poly(3-hydroxybutyrate) depolymerase